MISAISSSLAGLNAASTQVNNAAAQVVSGGPSAEAAVDLMQGETSYKANIAMMKMEADMQNQLAHIFDKTV